MVNGIAASALLNVLAKAQCQTGSKPYCILSDMLTQEEPKLCYVEVMEGRCVAVMQKILLQRFWKKQASQ